MTCEHLFQFCALLSDRQTTVKAGTIELVWGVDVFVCTHFMCTIPCTVMFCVDICKNCFANCSTGPSQTFTCTSTPINTGEGTDKRLNKVDCELDMF